MKFKSAIACCLLTLSSLAWSAQTLDVSGSLKAYLPTLAKQLNNPKLASIEETELTLSVNPDSGCEIVDNVIKARNKNLDGELACVFEWVKVPPGLSSGLLKANGIATEAGINTIGYQITFYSGRNAERVVVNSEDINLNLALPKQPVITGIESYWDDKAQQGLTSVNFSEKALLKKVTVKVEERRFDQRVSLSRLGNCIVKTGEDSCDITISGGRFGSTKEKQGYSMHWIEVNSMNNFFPKMNELFTILWDYRSPELVGVAARFHSDYVNGNFPDTTILAGEKVINVANKEAKIVVKTPYETLVGAGNALRHSADLTQSSWIKKGTNKPAVWATTVRVPNGFGDARSYRFEQKGMNGKEASQLSQCVKAEDVAAAQTYTFSLYVRSSIGTLDDKVGLRIDTGCNEGEGEQGVEQWFNITEQWQKVTVTQTLNTQLNDNVAVYIYGNNAMDEGDIFFMANPHLTKGEGDISYIPTMATTRSVQNTVGDWRIPQSVEVRFVPDDEHDNPDHELVLGKYRVLREGNRKPRGDSFKKQSSGAPEVHGQYFVYTIDLDDSENGVYVPQVTVRDQKGNEGYGEGASLVLDDKKPELNLYYINRKLKEGDGIYFIEDMVISADDVHIGGAKVETVSIDGQVIDIDNSHGNFARINTLPFEPEIGKEYTLAAKAIDLQGNPNNIELKLTYMPNQVEVNATSGQIYQHVQQYQLKLLQRKGLRCQYYSDKARALQTSSYGRYSCYVDFSGTGDMAVTASTIPTYQGVFTTLGENTVSYRYVLVNPNGVERVMAQGKVNVDVIEPVKPIIEVYPAPPINDQYFSASLEGGDIASAIISASNGELEMEINAPRQDVKTYRQRQSTFKDTLRFGRRLRASAGQLWQKETIAVKGRYALMPQIETVKNVDVVYVPSKYIKASLKRNFRESLNNQKQIDTIEFGIYDRTNKTYVYDEETMGKWSGYLALREGDGTIIPITPEKPITNGKADFEIDISQLELGSVSYVGVLHLESEVPGYERQLLTNRNYIRVWKGTEIEGGIRANRIFGRVPFTFFGRYQPETLDDYRALGSVVWEITQDDENWQQVLSERSPTSVRMLFDKAGVSKIRARVTNKFTGVESITDAVEITAFETPNVNIVGPSTMYYGETQEFKLMDRGELADDVSGIIEWSYDRKTWVEAGSTWVHTAKEDESTVQLHVRMRYQETDAAGNYAYDYTTKSFGVRPPSAPIVRFDGTRFAEVGKPFTFKVTTTPRYSGIYSEVQGRFILPDGTTVEGNELDIITPASWKDKSNEVIYEVWHKGLELETKTQKSFFIKGWQYDFPEFDFTVYQQTKFAPSLISVFAKRKLESYPERITFKVKYMPTSDMELTYEHGMQARFLANSVGVHSFKAIVSDSRGNTREFVKLVNVVQAEPPRGSMSLFYSNAFKREPLDITLYASVIPKHYLDRVAQYELFVNGQSVSTSEHNKGVITDLYEGQQEIKLVATTEHGHVLELVENIEVKDNQRPECKPTWEVRDILTEITSNCKDSDGRVIFYNWQINGATTTVNASSIKYYYPGGVNPGALTFTFTAYDDSNESTSLTRTIDTK
ncbi:phage head spike fiber domain-containing protein [Pseudoalteromonas sp. T1lg23B]|uniref:phage head spike fiber domain-containing protein n=1 Tax=Pseudoalteromonas sp. T1lg23B TaxID=2077097 RepID=UPI000CF67AFB|nr:hypothetical protein [Pseudoalteromonas sp. T1lg23B]